MVSWWPSRAAVRTCSCRSKSGRPMPEPGLQLDGRPNAPESTEVTVGTFDGVHRGHQAVLSKLISEARAQARTSLVVTFDPHPLRVVLPDAAPRLLCTTSEKVS